MEASEREQADSRTQLAECPVISELGDEISVAKRAYSTASTAGLSANGCILAAATSVAALNSRSPQHLAEMITSVAGLASKLPEGDAARAASHAVDAIQLGPIDTPHDIAVKILWVESGMRVATIRDDQIIVNKTEYEEKKARGKKVDTKEGTTLGPDKIDATGGAVAVLKRQVLRKEGNTVSVSRH
mgnify:CR=1 FL=1